MLRPRLLFPMAMLLWLIASNVSLAAESAWPALDGLFSRGPGQYLSHTKLFTTWLLFLAWVKTTDWASQDAQAHELRWALWDPILYFSFFLALLVLWIVALFPVGLTLLLLAYFAPLITYVVIRNGQVPEHDKVLTGAHLHRVMAQSLGKIGIHIAGADVDARDQGSQVKISPLGAATERDSNVNLLTARQSPGWRPSRELLDDALLERATHIMLDFTADAVACRYQIDGVWHDREMLARDDGDGILQVYKSLANLKIEDRRSRQSGVFAMEVGKEKYINKVTTAGTQTGERTLVQMEPKKLLFKTMDELGMRAKMWEQVEAVLGQTEGMLVLCSLPGGGLSTTFDVIVSNSDRFVRNFTTITEVTKPEHEIENLHVTTYSAADGETPATVLPRLIRTYPDVICVRDVADQETLSILCEQTSKRYIVTSVRAKEAVEALLRLMMLKVPPAEVAPAVSGVLNVRLVRKLCDECRESYPPPAEVLKQLGLPAGKIEALYRPPTKPTDGSKVEICDKCAGVGYFGRTAFFEFLTVDDDLRQVMTTAPKLENLRATARKARHRTLQEEGVLLVARGVTSLQELLRVLKQ